MTDDLVKRLTIKAAVIEMGEKIQFGSDTALMREAADRIEELDAKMAKAVAGLEKAKTFFQVTHCHAAIDTIIAELKGEKE